MMPFFEAKALRATSSALRFTELSPSASTLHQIQSLREIFGEQRLG